MKHHDNAMKRPMVQPSQPEHPMYTRADARSTSVPPLLLTDEQAADVFGVSLRTFCGFIPEPWMPKPIQLGPRLRRWAVEELRAAIAGMPRQTERTQPESLLRSRIERAKVTGVMG